ncbi:type I pantothenate kinase [Candidatus Purcelliella pentastirinorum]|uniref:type I pantothenate kinase n=1 Tax=Candidatus Purcelliella pentastirinorum TaxID=472834 RepID=UPI00237B8D86|nr:type I pantothenate kinase [Candidatus Purcelliella pentastirinorum]WDR80531.1 type I pantothenate kinase [Candidatus Purcelliella pentastirinorum]
MITKNKNSTPYIIGITGSVASGKTTLAQTIKIFLKKYLKKKITNISTDNFLYSNKKLEKKKITHKKGFPESYNFKNLMKFLQKVKLKKEKIKIPKYSHLNYDIIKNKHIKINKTDILILEGLNILQIKSYQQQKNKQKKILSDLINFSIYVHAPEKFLKKWYKDRLLNLYKNRNQYKECFLKKFNNLTKKELFNQLTLIWNTINKLNLTKNILPTKERATLILNKTYNHKINKIKYKI